MANVVRDELARGTEEEERARRERKRGTKREGEKDQDDEETERKTERAKEKGCRHSKEREEESPARVEAADGQTLRDPQAGVFELRPLCRLLATVEGRQRGQKKGVERCE